MNILIACEESQRVCIEFRKKGHSAFSCDIIDCSGGHPEWHIKTDVFNVINKKYVVFKTEDGKGHAFKKWDMIIAFPPCTYLTNSQNCWYNIEKYGSKAIERYTKREQAIEFFVDLYNVDCDKLCIENPVGFMNTHFKKPSQIIQPWYFGDNVMKTTCLWLRGLPPLKQKYFNKPESMKSWAYHNLYDKNGKCLSWNSSEIKILRSKTFPGIAKAMAEQWG